MVVGNAEGPINIDAVWLSGRECGLWTTGQPVCESCLLIPLAEWQ